MNYFIKTVCEFCKFLFVVAFIEMLDQSNLSKFKIKITFRQKLFNIFRSESSSPVIYAGNFYCNKQVRNNIIPR